MPAAEGEAMHPRDYAYDKAERTCDVVMKGGITSGVVYPFAVCELACEYRFKNVGGTSAGAIAAAVTAAAELGRDKRGFQKLAELPDWLGDGTNLQNLFQPQESTRDLHRLLMAAIGPKEGRPGRIAKATLRGYPKAAILGAIPGAGLLAGALRSGGAAALTGGIGAAATALLGPTGAIGSRIYRDATHAVPENFFGICSGMPGPGGDGAPSLTPWLEAKLRDVAGGLPQTEPLTFGHLWDDPDDRRIQLEMMTTNLTNRRAERLPFTRRGWYFSPDEFRKLFPKEVVDAMVARSPSTTGIDAGFDDDAEDEEAEEAEIKVEHALLAPELLALPAPADLPVIVATRMSLSFPVLLSAIPLWRIDRNLPLNQGRHKWEAWAKEQGAGWDGTIPADPSKWPAPNRPMATRHWFSDGGVASNFPIHFFDRFLPRWPTFGINLRPFEPYYTKDTKDESKNVSMPTSNRGGINEWTYEADDEVGFGAMKEFLGGIVRTMQNRIDEGQMRMPGYRDRVVHILHDETEGGMNLSMPKPVIDSMTARGQAAGSRLVEVYTAPAQGSDLGWDNHRWVRLRTTLAALEEMHEAVVSGYGGTTVGGTSYEELLGRPEGTPPTSYEMSQRLGKIAKQQIEDLTRAVEQMAELKADGKKTFADGAPRPESQARIVPKP